MMAFFAALIAAGTTGVVLLTLILVINPKAASDLFPGLREPTPTIFAYKTPVPPLPPTWTPSPTFALRATPSYFPSATWTPFADEDIDVQLASATPGPTITASRSYPFRLAEAAKYEANTNDQGCDWMSIAGEIWDMEGNPLFQVGVVVTGESFEQFAWAGSATGFGPSGYEVQLNTSPYQATWRVRLLNFNTMPISDEIVVRSREDCNRNVILVDFEQWQEWKP